MNKDNVVELIQPGEFKDHLTEVLRQGAQTLVLQAVKAEFFAFLESHSQEKLEDGRKRVVRHGYLPERKVVTGIKAIPVRGPRARDRQGYKAKDPIRLPRSCFLPMSGEARALR